MTIITEGRRIPMEDTETDNGVRLGLRTILDQQQRAKLDVVVRASALRYTDDGRLVVPGIGPETLEGDTPETMAWVPGSGTFDITDTFERQILGADRLAIHASYARRMRDGSPEDPAEHLALLAHNANYWLQRETRSFLVRLFQDPDGGGIARACLSNGFGVFDHADFLTAAMKAMAIVDQPYELRAVNLTEKGISLDVIFPEITHEAEALMRGYVAPDGTRGEDRPLVRAGYRFSNSETGHGRWRGDAFAEFLACTNGQTVTRFAPEFCVSHTHRGSRLAEGRISWSQDTLRARVEALTLELRDVMVAFTQPGAFTDVMGRVEQRAGLLIPATDSAEVITKVSRSLGFTEAERDSIFTAFNAGRLNTRMGLAHAITAVAQDNPHPGRAVEMEAKALDALFV